LLVGPCWIDAPPVEVGIGRTPRRRQAGTDRPWGRSGESRPDRLTADQRRDPRPSGGEWIEASPERFCSATPARGRPRRRPGWPAWPAGPRCSSPSPASPAGCAPPERVEHAPRWGW